MKTKWMTSALIALLAAGLLASCASAPVQPPVGATAGTQIANPWKDATPAQAAATLGGTFYNLTTLGSDWKQYALLVTTDDAVKNGSAPTAWVRFKKGEEDVSLQMFKGEKLSAEQLKGKETQVSGAPAYYLANSDGTSSIAWEANGILFEISASTTWDETALAALGEGVQAQK